MTNDEDIPNLTKFRKIMKKATKARKYSGDEGVKSTEVGARTDAREFAFRYALENVITDKALREEIIAKKASIPDAMYDQWLLGAIEKETLNGTNAFFESRDSVLNEARADSLESLAKGFLNLPVIGIEGHDFHNKIAAIHQDYSQLARIIGAHEQKQVSESDLYKLAVEYGQKENRGSENEDIQAMKVRARFNQLFSEILTLSSSLPLAYLKGLSEKRKKQAAEALKTNEAKADYALRNMREISERLEEDNKDTRKKYDIETDEDKKEKLGDKLDEIYAQKAGIVDAFYKLVK